MATLGDLVVGLGLDRRGFSRGIGAAQNDLSRFVGTLAAAGTAGLGLFAVKLAADAEQTKTALKSMLGSAELAEQVFAKLEKFSASTPFQSQEINEAAQKLIAFNTSADEVIPTLRAVGDVAAAIGAPLGQIAEIYGKAKVQGRLFGEDINQLTGRGIPIISELAKQFGVAESEVKKLVASGQVNFSHLEAAFRSLTGEGGKFSGMMEAQSKTLKGAWSTLLDNLKLILKDIGDAIIEAFDLKDSIKGATSLAQVWRAEIMPVMKLVLKIIGGVVRFMFDLVKALQGSVRFAIAFVAALVAITVALKAVAVAHAIVLALKGPAGWAILAGAAAVAGVAIAAVNSKFDKLKESAKGAASDVDKLNKNMKETPKAADQAARAINRKAFAYIKQADALHRLNPALKLNEELDRIERSRGAHLIMENGRSRLDFGVDADQAEQLKRLEIDKATGVFSRIKETTDALRVLRGETTETEIALQEMLRKGAPPEVVAQLRGLMKDLEKNRGAKAERDALNATRKSQADSIKQSIATPIEKFQEKVKKILDLRDNYFLDANQANAAIDKELAALKNETKGKDKRTDPRFADRLDARSAEGFAAVTKAIAGRPDKQDKANDLLKEIAKSNVAISAALDRANGIAEETEEQEPVDVGSFN